MFDKERIDRARDVRSIDKYYYDLKRGIYNGELALRGYLAYLFATTGQVFQYDYDDDIQYDEFEMRHDADIYLPEGKIPFSIKTCVSTIIPNPFYMRYYETCDIAKHKNGKILIASPREFTVFNSQLIWKYDIDCVEAWGNKKCFLLNPDDFDWIPFLTRLEFKS